MTDALIEEIYILARESFQAGQSQFQVHAFPFRLTEANMARHKTDQWYPFWKTLKEGYDSFEKTQVPPKVAVCSSRYLLNANFFGQEAVADPQANCPAYKKIEPQPFNPFEQSGPTLIQAKAQPATTPVDVTHVAAVGGQSRPAEPAVKPFAEQALRSAGEQQAQPVAPVLAGGAATPTRATTPPTAQAVAATSQPAQQAAAAAQPEVKKPLETRGIHNVVESGKSDMIITTPTPSPAATAPPQYTYGQANTAGSGAAFR